MKRLIKNKEQTQPTEKELTLKQRKWIKAYIETGSATEAAMQVYDCKDRDSAANVGYDNVRKLDYTDFLEVAGVTDNLLQKKMMEGLDSTKPSNAAILLTQDGKTVKAEEQGLIETPDYLTRHKYLETVLKLKRRLTDQKSNQPATQVNVLAQLNFDKYKQ